MMNKKTQILAFLVTLYIGFIPGVSASTKACEQVVAVAMQQDPYTVYYADKGVRGAYVTLLERIMSELEINITWVEAKDAVQAEAEAASGRADLLLAVPLTRDRLQTFDFIHPSLPEDEWMVWFKEGAFDFSGWNDLRGLKGASTTLFTIEPSFQRFAKGNLELSESSPVEAFDALSKGRLDYVIYPKALIESLGIELQTLGFASLNLKTQPIYLALSHQSACNDAWLRGKLAQHMLEPVSLQALLVQEAVDED